MTEEQHAAPQTATYGNVTITRRDTSYKPLVISLDAGGVVRRLPSVGLEDIPAIVACARALGLVTEPLE